jgi:hypothetical protein
VRVSASRTDRRAVPPRVLFPARIRRVTSRSASCFNRAFPIGSGVRRTGELALDLEIVAGDPLSPRGTSGVVDPGIVDNAGAVVLVGPVGRDLGTADRLPDPAGPTGPLRTPAPARTGPSRPRARAVWRTGTGSEPPSAHHLRMRANLAVRRDLRPLCDTAIGTSPKILRITPDRDVLPENARFSG